MSAALPLSFTNEISSDYLRTLDKTPFTEQQFAEFDEHAMSIVRQQEAYREAYPIIGIYRLATEGSQTRNGGVIQQATTDMTITLGDGQEVRAAQVGDCVVYPDGSTAHIVTGAGHERSHLALVGSRLGNGDEIMNTPQDCSVIVARVGISFAEDFLPTIEGLAND